MKPPSGPKKQTQTKPVLSAVEWANFNYPQRHALSYAEGGKTEVRYRFSEVRYLTSAFCIGVYPRELLP